MIHDATILDDYLLMFNDNDEDFTSVTEQLELAELQDKFHSCNFD